MAKDVTNRRAEEHVDEDQNGVIVAGPEAHAREHAGKDPAHKASPSKDKNTGKSAAGSAGGAKS
jgi:hypothetical protein